MCLCLLLEDTRVFCSREPTHISIKQTLVFVVLTNEQDRYFMHAMNLFHSKFALNTQPDPYNTTERKYRKYAIDICELYEKDAEKNRTSVLPSRKMLGIFLLLLIGEEPPL